MRVAVTVEQSWHAVPGGIATSTVELLRALTHRGDLDLVGVSARHREPPPEAFRPPVPIRQLPLPRRALYEAWQWLRHPVVERATGAVDVVHDAGYVVPPSKAPLVATVHDLLFLRYPDHYTWHSRAVLRRGLQLASRHAAIVICPSRATMDACRGAGIDPDRLRLVPWGVHVRSLSGSEAAEIRRRFGIERPYVLFCGTREPRKNIPRVLEAFRLIDRPDFELVLAGPPGWKEDVTVGMASLEGRVRPSASFPATTSTPCTRAQRSSSIRASRRGSAYRSWRRWRTAFRCVTSAGTATEEVAGDAALLVDPLDVDAIAAAIERVLDDRTLAESLGAAAEGAGGVVLLGTIGRAGRCRLRRGGRGAAR